MSDEWTDIGNAEALALHSLQRVVAKDVPDRAVLCQRGIRGGAQRLQSCGWTFGTRDA